MYTHAVTHIDITDMHINLGLKSQTGYRYDYYNVYLHNIIIKVHKNTECIENSNNCYINVETIIIQKFINCQSKTSLLFCIQR